MHKAHLFKDIPRLGVGLSHRNEVTKEILQYKGHIDFLEIIATRFHSGSSNYLDEIISSFPVILHELDLSLGSDEPLPTGAIETMKSNSDLFNAHWISDHLSMTKVDEYDLGHLTPVVYSEYLLTMIGKKIKTITGKLGKPFLVENVTYFFEIPGSDMDECSFFNRLFRYADCFMLLDINNLFVNSRNFSFNPYEYIEKITKDRVVEVHIGGSYCDHGYWIDSHGHPVPSEVWDLLEAVVKTHNIKAVVLERDQNLSDFSEILSELEIANKICQFKS